MMAVWVLASIPLFFPQAKRHGKRKAAMLYRKRALPFTIALETDTFSASELILLKD